MNNIKKKTCKDNKILNPLTNRCVSINSVIGKKILKNNINNNSNIDLKDNIIKHLTIIRDFEKNNNNIYKTRAYTSVLSQLYAYREPIKSYEDFKNNIKAGDKIKSKVEELIKTGKINYEKENIKQDKNYHLQNELRKIYGIGNVKIKELINSGIKSIDDLKKNQHLLNDKQKKGLQYYSDLSKLIPLNEYLKHIEILEKDLKKNNLIYDFVGSFRRGNNNMGDIDLLIMNNEKFDLPLYINKLKEKGYILEILALGKIKFSGIVKINNNSARQLDILVSPINEYYYSLLYFTGSAEFNIGLRNYLNNKYGISLSEHGFKENIIKIPLMKSEKEIFDFFNIKYVEPIKRKIFYSS